MLDISHYWGEDLGIGPTGDLGLAAGSPQVQQRILRRLLTNPGDYIWVNWVYQSGLSQTATVTLAAGPAAYKPGGVNPATRPARQ